AEEAAEGQARVVEQQRQPERGDDRERGEQHGVERGVRDGVEDVGVGEDADAVLQAHELGLTEAAGVREGQPQGREHRPDGERAQDDQGRGEEREGGGAPAQR
ncbi:hypothetical protein ADL26_20855, partial [Thermoactinomyces vulgaris]